MRSLHPPSFMGASDLQAFAHFPLAVGLGCWLSGIGTVLFNIPFTNEPSHRGAHSFKAWANNNFWNLRSSHLTQQPHSPIFRLPTNRGQFAHSILHCHTWGTPSNMSNLEPMNRLCDAAKRKRDDCGPSVAQSRPVKRRFLIPYRHIPFGTSSPPNLRGRSPQFLWRAST